VAPVGAWELVEVCIRPKMPNSVVATLPLTPNQRSNESVWLPLKFCPVGNAITEPIWAPVVLAFIHRPVVLVPDGATGMPAVV
jgi:hypothetical protein